MVPLPSRSGEEVLLEDLRLPNQVERGATYDVRVVARATGPVSGRLRLFRNADYLGAVDVELVGDRAEVFTFRQDGGEPGLYRYRAVLEVGEGADTVAENNQVVGTVEVRGEPRVLYVEGKGDGASRHLAAVLGQEDYRLEVVGIADMPATLAELRDYAAIILSDVPAYQLTTVQHEAVRSFVRDLGGGLVMVGGDESFGVGGYLDTPIEEALPVRMDPEDRRHFPSMAMVLAIDRSCSMGGTGNHSKIGMAREAGVATVELMSPRDEIGVVTFDSAASWAVPFRTRGDGRAIIDQIRSIETGGGTDIYPALRSAYNQLAGSGAALKHITLLSDGITGQAAFEPLVTRGLADGVTLTTIAIGADSDLQTMSRLAQWGGGRYYLATDIDAIPRIFTREAMLAYRSFLIEERFQPIPGDPSPILEGIDAASLPPLDGYVLTEARPRAQVALWGRENEPLLASWRYGLGKSIAWTSDCKERWSGPWIGTEAYTQTWSQMVRWVLGDGGDSAVDASSEIVGGEMVITVDAFDEEGGFRNFLDATARVIAPDMSVREVELRQIAPGRYQGRTPVREDGSHLAGVVLMDGDLQVGQTIVEAVQPYSPEYRPRGGGEGLMRELARAGAGRIPTGPAEVFEPPETMRRIPQPLSSPLLALAGLLLLADIAARRFDPFSRGAPKQAPEPPRQVFESSRPQAVQGWRAPKRRRPPPKATASAKPAESSFKEIAPEPPPAAAPAEPSRQEQYTSRLLSARRKARRRLEEEE